LDEFSLRLGRDEMAEKLDGDSLVGLRHVFAKLEERAADPKMRRTMRRLVIPKEVYVKYEGGQTAGSLTWQRQGDNEYGGQFPALKESVKFTVKGEDYVTPVYNITVVPPPSLVELVRDEERPAYMLYRVQGDDPNALRGLKQLVTGQQVSVTGGDTSRI